MDSKKVHRVKLPYRSRNVRRLVKYLEPVRVSNKEFFIWFIEGSDSDYYCLVAGKKYEVLFEERLENDTLSGLRLRLKIPTGVVDNKIVWSAKWVRSMYMVDKINCDRCIEEL